MSNRCAIQLEKYDQQQYMSPSNLSSVLISMVSAFPSRVVSLDAVMIAQSMAIVFPITKSKLKAMSSPESRLTFTSLTPSVLNMGYFLTVARSVDEANWGVPRGLLQNSYVESCVPSSARYYAWQTLLREATDGGTS